MYFHFLASSVMTVKQLNCFKAEVCIRINVILTVRAYVTKGLPVVPKGLSWPLQLA